MKACTWLRITADHEFDCYCPEHAGCLKDGICPIYVKLAIAMRVAKIEEGEMNKGKIT